MTGEGTPTGKPKFYPGMVFCVATKTAIARCINFVQAFKATDNESRYTHAGIITGNDGTTFEALWRIGYGNLDVYKGCPVIIARHVRMTRAAFLAAWPAIAKLDRAVYPWLRLPLHMVGLAKYIHWKYPVCSELVAKFEVKAGLRKNWWGIMPDHLADEWAISRYYDVIYEGEWT